MKPRDAEKLLGGYAAGILTEEEKATLFAAALEHQKLFDALAEEEALRELLADPTAKAHLLALLAPAKRPMALWRRPAFLGLAAGLFLVVTTSVVLLRQPVPEPPQLQKRTAEETPAQDRQVEARPAEAKTAPPAPRQKAAPAQDTLIPETPAQALPAPSVTAGGVGGTGIAVVGAAPEKKENAPAPPAAAVVEVVAAVAEQAAPTTTASRSNLSPEKLVQLSKAGTPVHRLETLGKERFRLTVTRPPQAFLYVLKRSGAEVQPLAPASHSEQGAGHGLEAGTDTFEFTMKDDDHLDLYLLTEPARDPRSLPETGPVKGTRTRVK